LLQVLLCFKQPVTVSRIKTISTNVRKLIFETSTEEPKRGEAPKDFQVRSPEPEILRYFASSTRSGKCCVSTFQTARPLATHEHPLPVTTEPVPRPCMRWTWRTAMAACRRKPTRYLHPHPARPTLGSPVLGLAACNPAASSATGAGACDPLVCIPRSDSCSPAPLQGKPHVRGALPAPHGRVRVGRLRVHPQGVHRVGRPGARRCVQ
jgi:hypothetical protein